MNPKHYQLRSRSDRRAKKARCSCGWEGPWRSISYVRDHLRTPQKVVEA